MNDKELVENLRAIAWDPDEPLGDAGAKAMREAADHIESLSKALEDEQTTALATALNRLGAALRPVQDENAELKGLLRDALRKEAEKL